VPWRGGIDARRLLVTVEEASEEDVDNGDTVVVELMVPKRSLERKKEYKT
jgi:hypothetical protein